MRGRLVTRRALMHARRASRRHPNRQYRFECAPRARQPSELTWAPHALLPRTVQGHGPVCVCGYRRRCVLQVRDLLWVLLGGVASAHCLAVTGRSSSTARCACRRSWLSANCCTGLHLHEREARHPAPAGTLPPLCPQQAAHQLSVVPDFAARPQIQTPRTPPQRLLPSRAHGSLGTSPPPCRPAVTPLQRPQVN